MQQNQIIKLPVTAEDRQLLTIRVQGDDLEPLIDDMWKPG